MSRQSPRRQARDAIKKAALAPTTDAPVTSDNPDGCVCECHRELDAAPDDCCFGCSEDHEGPYAPLGWGG